MLQNRPTVGLLSHVFLLTILTTQLRIVTNPDLMQHLALNCVREAKQLPNKYYKESIPTSLLSIQIDKYEIVINYVVAVGAVVYYAYYPLSGFETGSPTTIRTYQMTLMTARPWTRLGRITQSRLDILALGAN